MAKQIIVKKEDDSKKGKKYCLNCGIDISHRAVSKFCCPACKAIYKQNQEFKEKDKPKIKAKKQKKVSNPIEKNYSNNQIERFNQRYGKTN